jgi:hypothetical protein
MSGAGSADSLRGHGGYEVRMRGGFRGEGEEEEEEEEGRSHGQSKRSVAGEGATVTPLSNLRPHSLEEE